MAGQLQLRSGSTTQHATFTGAEGEVTYNTDNRNIRIHDGVTVGGHPVVSSKVKTTFFNADTENTTGVRVVNGVGNLNLPFNTRGVLSVYSNEIFNIAGALRVYQTFQPDSFNDFFIRKWDGIVWSTWERLVKSTEAFTIGQNWVDVTATRGFNTVYTNTTTKAIGVHVSMSDLNNVTHRVIVRVNGVPVIDSIYDSGSFYGTFRGFFIVPTGSNYVVESNVGGVAYLWSELR